MSGPRVIPFHGPEWPARSLAEIVGHLRGGGLIAYPTETVYGLGSSLDERAVARLASLKGRDPDKPFLILVAGAAMARDLTWTAAAQALADALWPGPLTIILAAPAGAYPPGVRGARGTVAVRATPHAGVRALLRRLGGPITSTSANVPGGLPAVSAREAQRVVEVLGGGEEVWVLDGGTLEPSAPSTVVDCTVEPPQVTRAGALPVERLRAIIPEIHERGQSRPA